MRGLSPAELQRLARELAVLAPGTEVAAEGDLASLVVEFDGSLCQVLGADGTSTVASLPYSGRLPSDQLARVIERCAHADTLGALENPVSNLRLEVRLGAGALEAASNPTRGFVPDVEPETPVLHIRAPGEPIGPGNSLQLGIRVDADCYLTIVDVGPHGAVTVLFPTSAAREGYYPAGRVSAGEWHLIPDSCELPNRADFTWPVGLPTGLDTIRVYANTSLQQAEELRRVLASGMPSGADLNALREALAPRGLALSGAAPPGDPGNPGLLPGNSTTASATTDWTAVSLTVRVEEN